MKKYPKYKTTDFSWIPEIPMHWELSRFCTISSPKSTCGYIHEQLLSVYLDKGVIPFSDVEERRTNVTSLDLSKYQLVEPGDFVLNNQQAWRGSVGISKYKGIISPAYIIYKLSDKLNSSFADYLFRSSTTRYTYTICSKGVGSIQRNLDCGYFKNQYFPIPPLGEQLSIVEFLETKTSKIDAYVAERERVSRA